jgi:predicted dehydrogenase
MPVRVGVIGARAYAQRAHLPALCQHPDAELRVVCQRHPDRLTEVAKTFGVSHTYTIYNNLIQNDTLDAVTISLPHHLHYQAVQEALEHSLHVLIDKPMALRRGPEEELTGRAMPVVTDQDGLHQVAVTEAAYRSARYGIPVEC